MHKLNGGKLNKVYPLCQVLPYVRQGRVELEGDSIKVGRFLVFAVKGTKCIDCGLEAEFFKKELSNGTVILNLYGLVKTTNGHRQVLFMRDHIIPASRGGTKILKNLQPMCADCNNKKGDFISFHDKVNETVRLIKNYSHGVRVRTTNSYKLIRAIWRPNFSDNRWKING